jgi:hypothetical protein
MKRTAAGRFRGSAAHPAACWEQDTIPKPDGLATVTRSAEIERSSNDIGQRSKMIEDCSHCVRGSMKLNLLTVLYNQGGVYGIILERRTKVRQADADADLVHALLGK